MSRFEEVEAVHSTVLIADALSTPKEFSQRGTTEHELVKLISTFPKNADHLLGTYTRFELVGEDPEQMQQDVQKGVKAVLGDAMSGTRWSDLSVETWHKAFESDKAVKGVTAESITNSLNEIGSAINERVGPELAKIPGRITEPVGMAILRNHDGSFTYYMMLSKDKASLQKNRENALAGKTSSTLIKVGTFSTNNERI